MTGTITIVNSINNDSNSSDATYPYTTSVSSFVSNPHNLSGFSYGYIVSIFTAFDICDYCKETSNKNLCIDNMTICSDCFKKAMDTLFGQAGQSSITKKAIEALRGTNN
jgi:hypothetical protein